MMRLHSRRGQAIAASLRLHIRQDEVDSEDSGDESGGIESPSPSPTSPASPTQIAPSAQSSASLPASPTSLATSVPTAAPPIATAPTLVAPPPALTTSSSNVPPTFLDSTSTETTSSTTSFDASSSDVAPSLSDSTSTRVTSSALSLPSSSTDVAPTLSDSSSTRRISTMTTLVPTSFETQTTSSQYATSGISDSVLLPSKAPVREGTENSENGTGTVTSAKRIGIITGATVGAIGGCILIGLLIFYFCKRRAGKRRQDQVQEEVLADTTTRSQKSHSTILDQVMAAVYAWGNDPESIHRGDDARDAEWYPKEKPLENANIVSSQSASDSSTKPLDSVRVWLNKVTQHAPTFRNSQGTSLSKHKAGWPSTTFRGEGHYQELGDGVPQSREPTRLPPSSFPLLNQEPVSQLTYPPTVARPPSVSAVTEVSSRYTISSNSTWFRWG